MYDPHQTGHWPDDPGTGSPSRTPALILKGRVFCAAMRDLKDVRFGTSDLAGTAMAIKGVSRLTVCASDRC